MPSLSEVMKFRAEMHEKSMGLIKQKGADYNRDQQEQGDTLFNLRVCEILGIVPITESGILVRLSDKLMRLISLTKPGREAAVKDESVLDTIADIHNYVDYLGLIWQQRKQSVGMPKSTDTLKSQAYVADRPEGPWKPVEDDATKRAVPIRSNSPWHRSQQAGVPFP